MHSTPLFNEYSLYFQKVFVFIDLFVVDVLVFLRQDTFKYRNTLNRLTLSFGIAEDLDNTPHSRLNIENRYESDLNKKLDLSLNVTKYPPTL